jgi:hypothetical protein
MNLRKGVVGGLVAVALITITLGAAYDDNRPGTVTGYVLDSACLFVKNIKKPLNAGKRALECAKAGSPLAILADDGTIYWPISDAMPATGQNARLMESAGQKVAAQRKLFERGGSHPIALETIAVVPGGN